MDRQCGVTYFVNMTYVFVNIYIYIYKKKKSLDLSFFFSSYIDKCSNIFLCGGALKMKKKIKIEL